MPRETMARIEKKMIPASGKVKLRDLVHKLGGVLFWDSDTRTVTACVPGLELVMHIGSDIMKVNGKDLHVGSSPLLIDGRTIIDASVIQQAFAAAKSGTKSASIR
jgi:hypothetical protein